MLARYRWEVWEPVEAEVCVSGDRSAEGREREDMRKRQMSVSRI